MSKMRKLIQLLVLLFSIATFIYVFGVLVHLIRFLSLPRRIPIYYTWVYNLLDNRARLETAYGPMVTDAMYLAIFILQHSLMKTDFVKNIFHKLGLSIAMRVIYCLTSSLCLEYLIENWLPAQSIVLWKVNATNNEAIWWTFVLIHGIGWLIIYSGCIIMDISDILGIKQAYYDIRGRPSPDTFKSQQLKSLHAHTRHPSFIGFMMIFWVTNLMTLDRFLLSVVLTMYMYCCWSPTPLDVAYQKHELIIKKQELLNKLEYDNLRYY